ncbi:hypothetical protein E2562_035027 [Oryza meyeriana var. granulata]|uniref:Uncharacterized protein n=1 Tax=Oryza meyeriana var. granulata TaxID=110450 RepID=A0A6G1FF55_9ORYZ|nr:hypothetical protein E2562_035027 [Oryza meyeriana var. granulata]
MTAVMHGVLCLSEQLLATRRAPSRARPSHSRAALRPLGYLHPLSLAGVDLTRGEQRRRRRPRRRLAAATAATSVGVNSAGGAGGVDLTLGEQRRCRRPRPRQAAATAATSVGVNSTGGTGGVDLPPLLSEM